jgi:hypothetical protein
LTLQADFYRVKVRFGKLYADPRIFDSPPTFVKGYLQSKGLAREKADLIYETTEDAIPIDDTGRPSRPTGTGKFRYEGKTLRSEYMRGANIQLDYTDFGSGYLPADHRRYWMAGRWDDLSFEMKELQHQHLDTGIAELAELYDILKSRAAPTAIATVELPLKASSVFDATVRFLENQVGRLAEREGRTVEVYAAGKLESSERKALENRIGRDATASTVYVILGSAS